MLWLRHPSLALRYKDPEATARTFRDGWFCTGDLFTRDADGFFYHQGRSDELYKVAGQWVRPVEVEEAVLADEHVREAACVVVPDQDGFDRLALFVVPILILLGFLVIPCNQLIIVHATGQITSVKSKGVLSLVQFSGK